MELIQHVRLIFHYLPRRNSLLRDVFLCFAKMTLILSLWLLPETAAWAHKVNLFCYMDNDTLRGEGYFSGGRPAQKAEIIIYNLENDTVIGTTTTDEKGVFAMKINTDVPLRTVLNAGQGHRGEFVLERKKAVQPREQEAVIERDFSASECASLLEEFQILEQRVRQLEKQNSEPQPVFIISGVGWIIAVFSLIYIVKKQHAS